MKTRRQYTTPVVVKFTRDLTMTTFTGSPYWDSGAEDEFDGQPKSIPSNSFSQPEVENSFNNNAYNSNSFTQEKF